LKKVGDELGLELADFNHGRPVSCANPQLMRRLTLANGALDADGIINLPKFKTHGLMRFTGAVKNLFGCVPGTRKTQYHVKLANAWDFASMLVDIYGHLRPRLSLMDGVIAMEGNGPRNGRPRAMGLLLISTDPVALDATACRLIGLDPANVPTCVQGNTAGLGSMETGQIQLLGDDTGLFMAPEFEADRTAPPRKSRGRIKAFLNRQMSERPVIDPARCNLCGTCVKICPLEPKAVDWPNGDRSRNPFYDYGRCIRCFCCQETCPQGAILVENTLLGRALGKL
jgi:ferredoxin